VPIRGVPVPHQLPAAIVDVVVGGKRHDVRHRHHPRKPVPRHRHPATVGVVRRGPRRRRCPVRERGDLVPARVPVRAQLVRVHHHRRAGNPRVGDRVHLRRVHHADHRRHRPGPLPPPALPPPRHLPPLPPPGPPP